jgi:hypothetical protein
MAQKKKAAREPDSFTNVSEETRPGCVEVPGTVLEDADETVAWARTSWALPRGAVRRKKAAGETAAKKAPVRAGKR